eukprot:gene21026-27249_t
MAAFTPSAQLKLTNVAYVRLQKKGKRFEIACYRNKGMLANAKDLTDAFGTTDKALVCKEILDKGELQVSEKERGALFESMMRDVATIVADKSINPENNRPYTVTMIQNAMKQIHYAVSINKSAKSQALDAIRKLKEVMPIARASMLLRVLSPITNKESIVKLLCNELGLVILNEMTINELDVSLDVRIDPELFRKIEESVQLLTSGQGRIEVLQFRDSTPAPVVNHINTTITDNNTSISNNNIDNDAKDKINSIDDKNISKPTKKTHKKQDVLENVNNADKKSKLLQYLALSDSDENPEDDDYDIVDSNDYNNQSDNINDIIVDKNIDDESVETASESDDDIDDDEVYGLVKKNHKKKSKNKIKTDALVSDLTNLSVATTSASVSDNQPIKSDIKKVSKKSKRLLKEETKNNEKKIEELKIRINHDRLQSQSSKPIDSLSNSNQSNDNNNQEVKVQSCNTCGGSFYDVTSYRSHFRSEWHRHNLKRKMKNLPIVASEEEFATLPIEQIEI